MNTIRRVGVFSPRIWTILEYPHPSIRKEGIENVVRLGLILMKPKWQTT